MSPRRRQESIALSGGRNGNLWGLRVPCVFSQPDLILNRERSASHFVSPGWDWNLMRGRPRHQGFAGGPGKLAPPLDVPFWILRDGERDHVHDVELLMSSLGPVMPCGLSSS